MDGRPTSLLPRSTDGSSSLLYCTVPANGIGFECINKFISTAWVAGRGGLNVFIKNPMRKSVHNGLPPRVFILTLTTTPLHPTPTTGWDVSARFQATLSDFIDHQQTLKQFDYT